MTLDEARLALDRIDPEITKLFYERMAVVEQIAAIKKGSAVPVYNPEREQQVTDRLLFLFGDQYKAELLSLYERIFQLSRDRQVHLMQEQEQQPPV